jgi:hypothetical protein
VERFPGDKLPEIIEKYPKITKKLLELNAGRIENAEKNMVYLMSPQIQQKI